MKHLSLLFVGLGLLGCGPEWNGTFVGTGETNGVCSDGSSVNNVDNSFKLTLTDDGDTVTWQAPCGATVIADIRDDQANVRQASCPATTDANGITSSTTIEDGTLTLNDNSLRIELELSVVVSGAISATCSLTTDGTLDRIEE